MQRKFEEGMWETPGDWLVGWLVGLLVFVENVWSKLQLMNSFNFVYMIKVCMKVKNGPGSFLLFRFTVFTVTCPWTCVY